MKAPQTISRFLILVAVVVATASSARGQTAGMSLVTGSELVNPTCVGFMSPIDTLAIALVASGITQPFTSMTFRLDLNTSVGGAAFLDVIPASTFSVNSSQVGDALVIQLIPIGGCATAQSVQTVGTLRLVDGGGWEWIRYTYPSVSGAPARSYRDCTGSGHALDLWGCLELDINDPHVGDPGGRCHISMLKSRY